MRRLLLLTVLLTAAATAPAARAQDQVVICHATGNPQSPYVTITVDGETALEHVNHEDDLVPAPADGCPSTEVVLPDDTPAPTVTPEYAVPTPTPGATPSPPRIPPPRPRRVREDEQAGDDDGGVQGAGGGGAGGQPGLSDQLPAAQATQAADTRDLPMTGAELWLVAGAGIGFLLTGLGVRILSVHQPSSRSASSAEWSLSPSSRQAWWYCAATGCSRAEQNTWSRR